MNHEEKPDHLLAYLLRSPGHFFGDLWEFWSAWSYSRRWSRIWLIAIPMVAFLLAAALPTLLGSLQARTRKLVWYARTAEKLMAADQEKKGEPRDDADTAEPRGDPTAGPRTLAQIAMEQDLPEASRRAMICFERILQMEGNNKRARYFVASQYGRQGDIQRAREVMQSLAPEEGRGYPMAHLWLGLDAAERMQGGQEGLEGTAMHHLAIAAEEDRAPSEVLWIYSLLLAKRGDRAAAIDWLQRLVRTDPIFLVEAAQLAKSIGSESLATDFATRAYSFHQKRVEERGGSEGDWIAMAQSLVLQEKWEQATSLLAGVLQRNPTQQQQLVRRYLSGLLLRRYEASNRNGKDLAAADFGLLQASLNIDPMNPSLNESLERLRSAPELMQESAEQAVADMLATGGANTIAHLLLAQRAMQSNRPDVARKHLEIAHQLSPLSLVVRFQLAANLLQHDPSQSDRAYGLLEEFESIRPRDSFLQQCIGDLDRIAGRLDKATQRWERAIELGSESLPLLERLEPAYDTLGESDKVEQVRRQRAALESSQAEAFSLESL
jgi:tetratricopeptide (TPR) repeat protein